MSTSQPIARYLQLWNDILDRSISSIAVSSNGAVLSCGSADDVRNMFVGVDTSQKWSAVYIEGHDITNMTEDLRRSPRFWDVASQYKDAQRHRRAHLKIHTYTLTDQSVPHSASRFTQDDQLRAATNNITNYKYLILMDVQRVHVIVPDMAGFSSPPIQIRALNGTESIIVAVDDLKHSLKANLNGSMSNADFRLWKQCAARGLSMQIRCDFAITNSTDEIEATIATEIIEEITSTQGINDRYPVRPNAKKICNQKIFGSNNVVCFGNKDILQTSVITDAQAEIISRILCRLEQVTMGIPGLSSKSTMIMVMRRGEHQIDRILQAAEVLKMIRQHQEGGQVRRGCFCQALAIGYVIFATVLSALVGWLNFGKRETDFERLTDSVSVATLLLVSVFGLVKLTSEDDNAIRNTLLGHKVLRKFSDVIKYYKRHGGRDVAIQTALPAVDEPLQWLADGNTCYLQNTALGLIAYTDGVRASHIRQLGMLLGEKMMLDYRLHRSTVNSGDAHIGVHMERRLEVTDLKSFYEVGKEDLKLAGRLPNQWGVQVGS